MKAIPSPRQQKPSSPRKQTADIAPRVADLQEIALRIPTGSATLDGDLTIGPAARGLVLFAHDSGSSRLNPRNRSLARTVQAAGFGTLLLDLLTAQEEIDDAADGHLRFNIELLSERLIAATRWMRNHAATKNLGLGYFGASTGAAAALVAAARLGSAVEAVVSRGGRPDLAGAALPIVTAPTLLIVGARDELVLELNEEALEQLPGKKQLSVVPWATHLFEEPGAWEKAAALAVAWFTENMPVGEAQRTGAIASCPS